MRILLLGDGGCALFHAGGFRHPMTFPTQRPPVCLVVKVLTMTLSQFIASPHTAGMQKQLYLNVGRSVRYLTKALEETNQVNRQLNYLFYTTVYAQVLFSSSINKVQRVVNNQ